MIFKGLSMRQITQFFWKVRAGVQVIINNSIEFYQFVFH